MIQIIKKFFMDYKGDITPKEAFNILKNVENAFLVDVRTIAEWSFVGLPDLEEINKNVLRISWLIYPNMEVNPNFIAQLESKIEDKNAEIFFMCKTGGRSLDAAIAAQKAGFKNSWNVIDGFEGRQDNNGHRGTIDGWKAEGLPWVQS